MDNSKKWVILLALVCLATPGCKRWEDDPPPPRQKVSRTDVSETSTSPGGDSISAADPSIDPSQPPPPMPDRPAPAATPDDSQPAPLIYTPGRGEDPGGFQASHPLQPGPGAPVQPEPFGAQQRDRDDAAPAREPEQRTWTVVEGDDPREFEGLFLRYERGTVIVVDPDDNEIEVALNDLSTIDQRYVRERVAAERDR